MLKHLPLLFLLPLVLHAAPPAKPGPLRATPPAAAIGKTTRITFAGPDTNDAIAIHIDSNITFTRLPSENPARPVFDLHIPPTAKPGLVPLRLITPKGPTGLMMLLLDDLPVGSKRPGNTSPAHAQPITLPAAIDGACEELTMDYYRFQGKKGQRISVDAVAARIGSTLDPLVRLLDAAGHELVYCDDDPATAPDPRFAFTLPADGDYLLEIRDVNYDGGGNYQYHLRLGDFPLPATSPLPSNGPTEVEPNDSPTTASPLSIPGTLTGQFQKPNDADHFRFTARKGEKLEFQARTRTLGFPCDATLQLLTPDGVTLARSKSSDPDDASLTHTFADAGEYILRVTELNRLSGESLHYRLTAGPASPPFTLSVETDTLAAKPAGRATLKITATRAKDFKGAITLSADCPTLPLTAAGTIAEGKTEAQITFDLPPDAKPNTLHRLKILGRLTNKPTSTPAIASTTPALRKNFPRLLYPAPDHDGLIALWIQPPPPSTRPATQSALPPR